MVKLGMKKIEVIIGNLSRMEIINIEISQIFLTARMPEMKFL